MTEKKLIRWMTNNHFIWTLFFCLVYISAFVLSGREVRYDLDGSWCLALEYAFRHDLQFGKDVIFTFGPFGFLYPSYSQGNIVEFRVPFALIWCGFIAWTTTQLAHQIHGPLKYLFLAWFLGSSVVVGVHSLDVHVPFVMIFGAMVLMIDVPKRRVSAVVFLMVLAFLSLIKFTFFMTAVVSVLLCAAVQSGRRNIKKAILIVLLFSLFIIFFWLSAGQHMENLVPWIRGSLAVAGGYTDAMTTLVPKFSIFVSSVIAGLLFITAFGVVNLTSRVNIAQLGLMTVVLLCLFFSWKHGFTRADDHVNIYNLGIPLYFAVLLTRPFQEYLPHSARFSLGVLFVGVVIFCSLAANFQAAGTIQRAVRGWPGHLKENALMVLQLAVGDWSKNFSALENPNNNRLLDLPVARQLIGTAPVDAFNYKQSYIFANGLNYRPRPVIQGYSAYTDYLQVMNLAIFKSEQRPLFLLFNMETIDNRYPTLDDAITLPFIFNNYMPIAVDGPFLVLREKTGLHTNIIMRLLTEQTIKFNEVIELTPWNDGPIIMQVTMRPTFLGKVTTFLYHAPIVYLSTQTAGKENQYRFIPQMAERGFLVSPLIETNDDVLNLLLKTKGIKPENIKFVYASALKTFEENFTVRLYRPENFPPEISDHQEREKLARLRSPLFDH